MSAPESVFKVRVRRRLVEDLQQMHAVAAIRQQFPFEAFLGQLLEVAAVDFRRLRYPPSLDACPRGARLVVEANRKKLTEDEIALLVEMYERDGYTQRALSRRFRCSETTVSRIVLRHRSEVKAADDE